MAKGAWFLALGLAAAALAGQRLEACSCAWGADPRGALLGYSKIYRGTVIHTQRLGYGYRMLVWVEDVWHGPVLPLEWVKTGMGGGDCGYGFMPPGTKQIFLGNSESMCQPARDEDILWDLFGDPHAPGNPTMRAKRVGRVIAPAAAVLALLYWLFVWGRRRPATPEEGAGQPGGDNP